MIEVEIDVDEEFVEKCAEAVHKAYCDDRLDRGCKPYWTGGDYSKLDNRTKEIDRTTVRAVLNVLTEEAKNSIKET